MRPKHPLVERRVFGCQAVLVAGVVILYESAVNCLHLLDYKWEAVLWYDSGDVSAGFGPGAQIARFGSSAEKHVYKSG